MRRRDVLTGLGVGVAGLAGCTTGDTERQPDSNGGDGGLSNAAPDPTATPAFPLKIVSNETYVDGYSSGVRGVATNVSDEVIDYAEVEVTFYDAAETRLEKSFDNTTDLPPTERWRFDVMYLGQEEWAYYRIGMSITPFD